jgi:ankyrin repeat protein
VLCCGPLLYHDADTDPVNLYHQSVKDYLLSEYLQSQKELSRFSIDPEKTDFHIFKMCWQFLSSKEFDYGHSILKRVDDQWLLEVSQAGYKGIVQHLLNAGADLEAKNDNGWTALIRAAYGGHEAIVRLLLEKGADYAGIKIKA